MQKIIRETEMANGGCRMPCENRFIEMHFFDTYNFPNFLPNISIYKNQQKTSKTIQNNGT